MTAGARRTHHRQRARATTAAPSCRTARATASASSGAAVSSRHEQRERQALDQHVGAPAAPASPNTLRSGRGRRAARGPRFGCGRRRRPAATSPASRGQRGRRRRRRPSVRPRRAPGRAGARTRVRSSRRCGNGSPACDLCRGGGRERDRLHGARPVVVTGCGAAAARADAAAACDRPRAGAPECAICTMSPGVQHRLVGVLTVHVRCRSGCRGRARRTPSGVGAELGVPPRQPGIRVADLALGIAADRESSPPGSARAGRPSSMISVRLTARPLRPAEPRDRPVAKQPECGLSISSWISWTACRRNGTMPSASAPLSSSTGYRSRSARLKRSSSAGAARSCLHAAARTQRLQLARAHRDRRAFSRDCRS